MTAQATLSADVRAILQAFPFFFAWDRNGVIVATGRSLAKVSPSAKLGERVDAIFECRAPAGRSPFALDEEQINEVVIVRSRPEGCVLRGSVMILADAQLGVMLASPWMSSLDQLKNSGLTLTDFGPQDQTPDILQLLLSQQMVAGDLKELNAALTRERAKYRSEAERTQLLLRSASDGIHVLDSSGCIVFASESFGKMLGYDNEELINMHASQWDAYFDSARLEEWISELFRSEAVTTFETKHRRKDGSILGAEVTAHSFSMDGAPTLFCSARDITDRKRQARELEDLNARLAATIGAAMDGVVVMDARGNIAEFNPSAERMFGWKKDEVIGRAVSETLVPERMREAHTKGLEHYLKTGEGPVLGRRTELPATRSDGSEFPSEIEMDVARTPEGEVFVAFIRDVTDRKQNEAAIREYRENLEKMVAQRTEELNKKTTILDAIVTTSTSGLLLADEEGRIFMTNPALERMFGYSDTTLVGSCVEDLVPEAARAAHQRQREGFTREPKDRTMGIAMDLHGQRKDGTTFPADISLSSFQLDGKRYVQARIIDITERRKYEEQLRDLNANLEQKVAERTIELAEASAAKSVFLAHMSHEIRTPMNGILGLAQLLERSALTQDQSDMVRRIGQAGKSLLAILNDILDFSKIEAGEIRIEEEPFSLGALLSQVGSLLGSVARAKGVELHIPATKDADDALIGDALRLEQILMNLIGNAIKFSERSAVQVEVKTVTSTPFHVVLKFEVRDWGIGISKDQLARLFAPFSQADASITRRYGGTGLGLAISRRLVDLMDGTLGVVSTLGAGSTFWFEVPFRRQINKIANPQPARARLKKVGPRLSGLRCLVVDDSRMNRDVVQRVLVLEGAAVSTAADGQQVVELLRADADLCDVVLMDVQMPIMDGLTATRIIRHELHLTELPIVALTAGVLPEERVRAKAAGFSGFVSKPVDFEELLSVLLVCGINNPAPREPPIQDDRESAFSIPGIDIETAAISPLQDSHFYRSLAEEFVNEFADVPARLRYALENDDRAEAGRILHAIRGSAGYIGAADLKRAATKLEEEMLTGDKTIEEPTSAFLGALTTTIDGLNAYIHNNA